jgi:hypothetical protein
MSVECKIIGTFAINNSLLGVMGRIHRMGIETLEKFNPEDFITCLLLV